MSAFGRYTLMTNEATTTIPPKPIPLTRVAVNGDRLSDLVEALQQLDQDQATRVTTVAVEERYGTKRIRAEINHNTAHLLL